MADISKALKVVRQLNPLGLFSKATEEASRIPQAKGTGEQMRAALLKQGVKPDELRWTGFDEWAKGKKSVTRDEVAEFLKKNEVQVGEEVLGRVTKGVPYPQEAVKIEQEIMDRYRDELARLNSIAIDYYQPINARRKAQMEYDKLLNKRDFEIDEAIPNREALIEASRDKRVPTKFGEYTLPGGENYREVLLTRPEKPAYSVKATENGNFILIDNATGKPAQTPNGQMVPPFSSERQATEIAQTYSRALGDEKMRQTGYRSSHWNDPNVLAHLRMKERVDPQGRRVLHLEEAQSDWGQIGKKVGFYTDEASAAVNKERNAARQAQIKEEVRAILNGRNSRDLSPEELVPIQKLINENNMLQRHPQGVPSAPYVESTPGWTNLALRRALVEAAQGNFDTIAWTPGKMQAARYPEGGAAREAGMVGYYDKIFPTQISKVLKDINETPQFGTVSVSRGNVGASGDDIMNMLPETQAMSEAQRSEWWRALDPQRRDQLFADYRTSETSLPSFNLTPAMREKIKEGLPLFTMMPAAVGLGAAQMQERAKPAAPVEGANPAVEPQTTEPREGFQGGGRTEMTPEEYNRALEMAKDVLRQQLRKQIDAANGGFDPAVPIDWQLSRPKITDRVPPQRVVARSVAPMAYAPVAPAAPAAPAAAPMAYAPVAPAAEAPAAPIAARQQGPVERAMAVVRSVPQAVYEVVSSPVATAQNIAREIFSGNNYQSTGEPIMSDGRLNWGDPESAADFFRADKALQEMRPYREDRASGGRLLEDEYPTQYLPDVGRQVMADGGDIQDKDYFSQLYESKKLFDRPLPSLSYNTDREGISVGPARENLFQKHYEEMKESKRPYVSGKTTMPFLGGNLSFQGSYMPERGVPKKSFGAELEYKFADGGRAIDVARQVMADGGDTMAGFMPPSPDETPDDRGERWQAALRNYRNFPVRPGEATLQPADITARDYIAQAIAGEGGPSYGSELRKRAANLLVGSRGLPDTGIGFGLADAPMVTGIPLQALDIADATRRGNYGEAALGAALPVAFWARKPIISAGRRAVEVAGDVLGRVPAPVAAGAAGAAAMTPTEAEAGPAGTIVRAAKKAAAPAQTFRGSDLIAKDPNAAAVILSKRDPAGAVDFGQAINRAEYTFTPKGDLQPWKEFDPVQAVRERGVITGLLGDRSAAGSVVHDINGVRLTEPVNRSGGGEFQRSTEGPEVWASRPGAVRNMYTRINKGMEEQGISRDVPVFASHVLMGLPGIDSTQKMAKGILRQIEPTRDKIDLKVAAAFDEAIRKKYPKWPGILNSDEAEKFLSTKEVGKRTSTILQQLDTAGAQKGGLPNLGATRFAMMEPRLVSADQGATGFAISRLDPRGITNVAAHDTYPRGMLGPTQSAADYMGGTRYQVPLSVMFPDWWKTVKPTYVDKKSGMTKKTTPTMIQQSVLTQVPLQRASQEWLDNLMAYMEANPKKWGYRHGGGVSHRAMMIAKELGSSPRETVTS